MTNKEKIKKTISNDYDKDKNYNVIMNRIERRYNMKKSFKYSFIPICLVAVLSIGIIIGGFNKELKNNSTNGERNNIPNGEQTNTPRENITINELTELSITKFDAKAMDMNGVMIPYIEILSELVIPDDFDNKDTARAIWIKSNSSSKDYDILNNYEFDYFNTKNNRKIVIALSDKYKPLRDYKFSEDDSAISRINDIEFKIYKYKNIYMTAFTYKGFNFDIETTDITESEFFELLSSIIK